VWQAQLFRPASRWSGRATLAHACANAQVGDEAEREAQRGQEVVLFIPLPQDLGQAGDGRPRVHRYRRLDLRLGRELQAFRARYGLTQDEVARVVGPAAPQSRSGRPAGRFPAVSAASGCATSWMGGCGRSCAPPCWGASRFLAIGGKPCAGIGEHPAKSRPVWRGACRSDGYSTRFRQPRIWPGFDVLTSTQVRCAVPVALLAELVPALRSGASKTRPLDSAGCRWCTPGASASRNRSRASCRWSG